MFERVANLPVTDSPASPQYVVERSTGPNALWTFRFSVVGRGDFPFDMLRYDRCYPIDSENAARFATSTPGKRGVMLQSDQPRALWRPTFGRWQSFGWFVSSDAWDAGSDG